MKGLQVLKVCPEGQWGTIPSVQVVLPTCRITRDLERLDYRPGFSLLGLGFSGVSPFPLEKTTPAPNLHHSPFQTGGKCCRQVATWLQERGSPSAGPWGFILPQGEMIGQEATACSPEAKALTLGLGSTQQASGAWGEWA